jgi:hypothetical protein
MPCSRKIAAMDDDVFCCLVASVLPIATADAASTSVWLPPHYGFSRWQGKAVFGLVCG